MEEKLTPKEKGFIDDYLDTGNATEAARRNYDVKNDNVAGVIGWENLRKPKIQQKIQDASELAFSTILALSQGADNESVRLNASKDILDRGGFKPTDKTDITSGGEKLAAVINIVKPNGDNV